MVPFNQGSQSALQNKYYIIIIIIINIIIINIFFPFYRWGTWGTKRKSDLLQVIKWNQQPGVESGSSFGTYGSWRTIFSDEG